MKKVLMFLTLLLALVSFGACKSDESKTVRVGSCGPLTGPVSVYGQTVKKGMELAIKEINEDGGVKVGDEYQQIELVDFINDEHNGDKAKGAFTKLYDKGIDVFLGAVTSAPTEAVISEAIKTGIPVLTPTATAESITVGADGTEGADRFNVFRGCFNDNYQGLYMAKFVKDQNYKKVAVMYNNEDDYSTGLYNALKDALGTDVVVEAFPYQGTTSTFRSTFEGSINTGNFDAIYIPDYYEKVATIISDGRASGYDKAFLGCDGWDGIQDIEGYDKTLLEGCFFTNHYAADDTDTKVQEFVASYKAEYDNEYPTALAVLGYDIVFIMKAAIEKAGSKDSQAIIDALTSVDFAAKCVTGDISYNEKHNPEKNVTITTYDAQGNMKFFKKYSAK